MTAVDLVVVPSAPVLLPEYAGLTDPVADLRAAARAAVSWLVDRHPERVTVLAAGARVDNAARGVSTGVGLRLAEHLLGEAGFTGTATEDTLQERGGVLAVANGSAKRGPQAPGHLDERAAGFDEHLGRCLREGDTAGLQALDARLGEELWAHDVPVLQALGGLVDAPGEVAVDFADDPFGVQCWVVRWACGSWSTS
jgi:hypothetical protein